MHGLIEKVRLLTLSLTLKMLQKENVNEYDDDKYQQWHLCIDRLPN